MAHMELQFPADAQEEAVHSGRNISDTEKWLSIAAGTGLALYGISRRNKQGWLMTAIGGMLLQRGTTGHCHLYEALGLNTAGTGDDTRRALGGSAVSSSTSPSRSAAGSRSCTASGGTSRTCRSS